MEFSKVNYLEFCSQMNYERGEFNDGYDLREIEDYCPDVIKLDLDRLEEWFNMEYNDFELFKKYLKMLVMRNDICLALDRISEECMYSRNAVYDYTTIILDNNKFSLEVISSIVHIMVMDTLELLFSYDLSSKEVIKETESLFDYAISIDYPIEGYTCMSYKRD